MASALECTVQFPAIGLCARCIGVHRVHKPRFAPGDRQKLGERNVVGQTIVHGKSRKMLAVVTRNATHCSDPQVPLLVLAQCIGLRLDEAMFYIQIDEVVLLRPYSCQHYPTYGPTYASFHPVDNMLASYNLAECVWRFYYRRKCAKICSNEARKAEFSSAKWAFSERNWGKF